MWNCFAGQKYLLEEMRRQCVQVTSLPQQLQNHLASFDRRTSNYSSSLTHEFLPSTQSSAAVSTNVSTRVSSVSTDVLILFSPSASTSNDGNQHVPVAEARQSEDNTLPADIASPDDLPFSPDRMSHYGASSPNYSSNDESEASVSQSADWDHTPRHPSDIDGDEQFDADERVENNAAEFDEDEVDEESDLDSCVDEEYQSHSYDEYESEDTGPSVVADSDNDSDDSSLPQSPQHNESESNMQRHTLETAEQMPSLNVGVEETDNSETRQQRDSSDVLQARQGDSVPVGDVEGEQPRHGTAALSSKQQTLTHQLRLDSHRSERVGLSDDAGAATVQASSANDDTAAECYQGISRLSHSLSSVDSADDNEVDGTRHQDNGDEQLSAGSVSELSDFNYNQTPRHYRSRTSSTSVSSLASPSLHDDNDSVDEDEVLSPKSPSFSSWTFSPSDTVDDDDDDDRHQSSDELSPDEDAQTSSPQRSLPRPVPNSQPVSSSLSVYEYNIEQQSSNARETSSQHSWTGSRSQDSHVFVDSESDSDESWSLPDRCAVKRQRSTSSAAASDDSDGDHQRHKMRRFH